VVADGMIGGRHRSNMELVAQGVANVVTPLFGGIPATGAIARTATNVKNGGRTPVAGIIHALTLLIITLFFGRYAALIPMAVLASILVVVAWHMSEWRTFRDILQAPRSDVAVLLVTFFLTVLVDLTVAIQVGMVLAAFLFMKRMAEVTNIEVITGDLADPGESSRDTSGALYRRTIPAGVEVYEINGPFFFGAAGAFSHTVGQVAVLPKVLVVRLRHVPAMDATGLHALRRLVHRAKQHNTLVVLSELQPQPREALTRSGLLAELGPGNVAETIDEALARGELIVTGDHPTHSVPTAVTRDA
jgi:SulP family sulfate permease